MISTIREVISFPFFIIALAFLWISVFLNLGFTTANDVLNECLEDDEWDGQ